MLIDHYQCDVQNTTLATDKSDHDKPPSVSPMRSGSRLQLSISSGFGALDRERDTYVFTNLLDGIDLFSSTALTHQGSIKQPVDHHNNLAIGLVVATHIVAGGFGGAIWLYDRHTKQPLARLQNPMSTGVSS
jgi:hypothetical protein